MNEQPNEMNRSPEFPKGYFDMFFKGLSRDKAEKYWNRYIKVNEDMIKRELAYGNTSHMYLSLYDANIKCGSFRHNGERISIWHNFYKFCPLFTVIQKGNNLSKEPKLSYVEVKPEYLDLLISTQDAQEIMRIWYADTTTKPDPIKIDDVGLRHYIISCERALEDSPNAQYARTVRDNMNAAKQIVLVSDHLQAQGISADPAWLHFEKPSPYGRVYYSGVSLQNVSKEVRRAALGKHYSYDLVAAQYAVRLAIAHDILSQGHTGDKDPLYGMFTNTKEYLDKRSSIRKKLAQHIKHYPDGEKLIKQAINAIGFGAKLGRGSWIDGNGQRQYAAISSIIQNKQDCDRFLNDPWVIEFCKEQQDLTDLIVDHYLKDSNWVNSVKHLPNMVTPTGRISKSHVMAYWYQHMEHTIIKHITQDIPVVIGLHDGFVTRQRCNMVELRSRLADISPYLQIEEEEHQAYRVTDPYEEELAHKQFIKQQEQMVARMAGKPTHVPQVKQHSVVYTQQSDHYTGSGYSQPNYDPDLDSWMDDELDK